LFYKLSNKRMAEIQGRLKAKRELEMVASEGEAQDTKELKAESLGNAESPQVEVQNEEN